MVHLHQMASLCCLFIGMKLFCVGFGSLHVQVMRDRIHVQVMRDRMREEQNHRCEAARASVQIVLKI